MLKIRADPKLLTTKPSTNLSQIKIIRALITNKNNPKVTIVTGNVKKTKIGFTKTLSKPKTTAIMTAVVSDATEMPAIKLSIIKTITAVRMMRMMVFIIFF